MGCHVIEQPERLGICPARQGMPSTPSCVAVVVSFLSDRAGGAMGCHLLSGAGQ
ncbi:MAG: hypothetical protein LBN04_00475 [Oscillospiraceae bacterium]|nr:hypothetical protein [Oscillospiraceae bacterium]